MQTLHLVTNFLLPLALFNFSIQLFLHVCFFIIRFYINILLCFCQRYMTLLLKIIFICYAFSMSKSSRVTGLIPFFQHAARSREEDTIQIKTALSHSEGCFYSEAMMIPQQLEKKCEGCKQNCIHKLTQQNKVFAYYRCDNCHFITSIRRSRLPDPG